MRFVSYFLPSFGVLPSKFSIITTTLHGQPWATPMLLILLGVAFAAIFGKAQPFGPRRGHT